MKSRSDFLKGEVVLCSVVSAIDLPDQSCVSRRTTASCTLAKLLSARHLGLDQDEAAAGREAAFEQLYTQEVK